MTAHSISKTAVVVVLIATVFRDGVHADDAGSTSRRTFVRDKVLPLLEARCLECHGTNDEPKGGLSLTSRRAILSGGESGEAVVPGKPDESRLIEAIRYEGFEMPPKSRMPDEEIRILVDWVKMGIPWPSDLEISATPVLTAEFPLEERRKEHWAWQPISPPKVADVENTEWSLDPVDRFVLAKLEAHDVQPAKDTDRATLLRRLTFDLIGLPPTIAETRTFVDDPRDDSQAIAAVVDRLLASPHFGERWGRHWLDLVRYAETLGHEFDYPLHHAWQYRDYVIRALNQDVPYDDFLREHIAGDLMEHPRTHPSEHFNESIIGTGFWSLHEAKHSPVDVVQDQAVRFDNQIDVFSRAFMGLTVACARCHDHKFDAIAADDYYALAGFLKSSRRTTAWLDPGRQIENHAQQLQQLSEQSAVLLDELRQRDRRELHEIPGDAWAKQLSPDVASDLSDPLSLAARLQHAGDAELLQVAKQWSDDIHRAQQTPHPSSVFADFSEGVPDGWTATDPAFADFTRSIPVVAGGVPYPVSATGVSSADLSKRLGGTLASPSFEIRHPEILIRIAGDKARVRLVIEGYVMMEFNALLFAGLDQKVNTDGTFQWLRLAGDLHRHQGRRAYLEIMDEGDGWFVVDQIRMADQGGAAFPAHRVPSSSANIAAELRQSADRDPWELISDLAWPHLFAAGLLPSAADERWTTLSTEWIKIANQVPHAVPVIAMTDGTPEEQPVYIRGNHRSPGRIAQRTFLTAVSGQNQAAIERGSGRMILADRLLDDGNPFPARVAVNRFWHHLFGRGIVASTDDFGFLGERPTHPELLDHLSDRFRRSGWSVKTLIRELVQSRTYRMSSQASESAAENDPTGAPLSAARVRRLDAEVIRDAMLKISGRLDPQLYGPPIPVVLSPEMDGRGRPQSGPLDGTGRRSIYISVNRNFLSPFLQSFDRPAPVTTSGKRTVSNVPAQALILLNNEFVHDQASTWAKRLLTSSQSADVVIRQALQEGYGRATTDDEVAVLLAFANRQAVLHEERQDTGQIGAKTLTDVCHVLMNAKEFIYLR